MNPNLRMGRISFLNVLPIYHPLEAGIIPHDYELVSGPPALLNNMMSEGALHVSSCSCFEYARRPDRYFLVEDLSIGSRGPVMSVLLLSRRELKDLEGREILISGESHTSVALLRALLKQYYHVNARFRIGGVSSALNFGERPDAFLAIGDEALRLRALPDYPIRVDLAEAWRDWTGLPFIFGIWVISANAVQKRLFKNDPGELLRQGRDWGLDHLDIIVELTGYGCPLSREELKTYYNKGLLYSLGEEETEGMLLFYRKLLETGLIDRVPELRFYRRD